MAQMKIPAGTVEAIQKKPGLTASQRASLKQSPAEKKAGMASAQGRMGSLVSNFAKRQRGEKTPTGVGRPARSQGQDYGGRGEAAEFLTGKHDAQLRRMAKTALSRTDFYKEQVRKTSRSPTKATQGRMGKIVSGVAKGLRAPGVAAKATKGRMGKIVSGVAKRLPGRSAAEAISSLSRPQKRKSTRNVSRSSGRR